MAFLIASADFFEAVDILKQYGPFCGVLLLAVVFFMWRDWKREDKLTKRIVTLEDDYRKTFVPLLEKCMTVISHNTVVIERVEKHLNS